MKIPITGQMVDNARKWTDQIAGTNLFDTPNYTELEVKGRFFTGYTGEQIFEALCIRFGSRYQYFVNTSGKTQSSEFHLYRDCRVVRVEVKTASQPHHRHLMNPVVQPIKGEVIVAVRLDLPNKSGEIMGAIPTPDFLSCPAKTFPPNSVLSRYIPFDLLPKRSSDFLLGFDKVPTGRKISLDRTGVRGLKA